MSECVGVAGGVL